jgi:hypothetical protein
LGDEEFEEFKRIQREDFSPGSLMSSTEFKGKESIIEELGNKER